MTRIPTAAVLACILAAPAAAQDHDHSGGSLPEQLGTVVFVNSCNPAAQAPFTRAVALLHSFEFAPAIAGFAGTLAADPSCAIAQWGIALSRWGNPFAAGIKPPAQLEQGRAAVAAARAIGAKTARERDYIDAVSRLFDEAGTRDQKARFGAYRDAMATVAASYGDDSEASIFYAVALAAAAAPSDKTYADQLKAGAILERLWVAQPDHPGLAHYIIHAYDVPALAPRALTAARRYAQIAPSAPHALHMPAHTFTRLGLWQESIDTNRASATVARQSHSTAEELHAMDYMVYAYLQTAQDAAADALLASLGEVRTRFDPDAIGSAAPGPAGVFALAAIPARCALERGQWARAATLEPHPSATPFADAMTFFARALGAARTGDAAGARQAVAALQQLHDRLVAAKESYWAEQVEIQRRGAAAWTALAEGRSAEALDLMRSAATLEEGTEKNAMTPGPLAPAGELLGDMLLQVKDAPAALARFEATLAREPNRFRSVYGAAKAAALAGRRDAAATHYRALLDICARGDQAARPELAEARAFLSAAR